MSKLMASVSGVRGIFGENLNPEIALKYAAHFGIFSKRGKIVVGRDSRKTGPAMLHAVISGLISVGCEVVDLGIVSTPTVLLAVENLNADGGISITASHNSAEWNAMKFVGENGMFLYPENAGDFLNSLTKEVEYSRWDKIGKLGKYSQATKDHIEKIMEIPYIDFMKIKQKKFKVVIDSVNGAGGVISPELLKELGCEVIEINSEPNGEFAHTPEPLTKNLYQIEKEVLKHKADLGFATDPDVDRLAVVSEKGKCIGEEFSLLLAEKFILSKKKGSIVTNLSSSMATEDLAQEFKVEVHRTKVGEINVGKKMIETKAAVGGEGNGGVICPEVHYTRDAPAGMAIILAYLSERDLKMSELAAEIPKYYFAKNKIETKPENLDFLMEKTLEIFAEEKLDRTDGIKIIRKNNWIHIRKSGTEPIIRVYVESDSPESANKICEKTIEKILD